MQKRLEGYFIGGICLSFILILLLPHYPYRAFFDIVLHATIIYYIIRTIKALIKDFSSNWFHIIPCASISLAILSLRPLLHYNQDERLNWKVIPFIICLIILIISYFYKNKEIKILKTSWQFIWIVFAPFMLFFHIYPVKSIIYPMALKPFVKYSEWKTANLETIYHYQLSKRDYNKKRLDDALAHIDTSINHNYTYLYSGDSIRLKKDLELYRRYNRLLFSDSIAMRSQLLDSINNTTRLKNFSGLYYQKYDILKEKADYYEDTADLEQSILYHRRAIDALNLHISKDKYSKLEQALTSNNLANVLSIQGENSTTDSLYLQSFENYTSITGYHPEGASRILQDWGIHLRRLGYYSYSNNIFKSALNMAKQAGSTDEWPLDYSNIYKFLALNYITLMDIDSARTYLDKYVNAPEPYDCHTSYMQGRLATINNKYQQAKDSLTVARACYLRDNKILTVAKTTLFISMLDLTLGDFPHCAEELKYCKDIICNNEFTSLDLPFDNSNAHYDFAMSNYLSVKNKLEPWVGSSSYDLGLIYLYSHALCKVEQYSLAEKNIHSYDSLLSINLENLDSSDLNLISSIGNSAYLNYHVNNIAKSKKQIILAQEIVDFTNCQNPGILSSHFHTKALIWDNLNHPQTDTLFKKALKLNLSILGDQNPTTVRIKLDYADYLLRHNKYVLSKKYLLSTLSYLENTFIEHDLLALNYFLLAKIFIHENDTQKATLFLEKAEIMFKSVLGNDHSSTQNTLNYRKLMKL